ncbi:hypothetical protein SCALM49S_01535 [Streptomyces californicus]
MSRLPRVRRMWWRRSSMRRVAEICSSGTLNWLLAALPLHVHHELPGDPERDLLPEVVGDEGEGQVEAGTDPGPGPDVSLADEDGSASTSISGCSAASWCAVDQWVVARFPSSSPAAASRCAPTQTDVTRRVREARAFTRSTSPASTTARTRRLTVRLHRAGDDERVDAPPGRLVEGDVGKDAHPGGGGHRLQRGGSKHDFVRRGITRLTSREREHLRRTGDVEQVDALEHHDDDEPPGGGHHPVSSAPLSPPGSRQHGGTTARHGMSVSAC